MMLNICNIRFNRLEHFDGHFVYADENNIEPLTAAEELEDLLDLWIDSIETAHTDYKNNFGFGWDVESAFRSSFVLGLDDCLFNEKFSLATSF